MTAQAMSAGTAETHSGSGRQPASAVRQDAPNPLYQAGYSMVDTTDQQAVTVAQEDREAAAQTVPDDGSHSSYMMVDAIMEGRGDHWPLVQAFARHRLASVSSASADYVLVPREPTDAMLDAWSAVAPYSDDEPIIRGWSVMLAASPEPVPATNQAGEVAKTIAKAVIDVEFQNSHAAYEDAVAAVIASHLAALATQPATSQEGEGWTSWRGGVEGYEQSLAVAAKELGDERKARSVLWLLGLDHVWKHITALRETLAVTPTPPTLSEDAVRKALERARSKLGHVSIDAMNGDNLAVTLCTHFDDGEGDEDENGWTPAASDGCDATLKAIHEVYVAALAQVKAS